MQVPIKTCDDILKITTFNPEKVWKRLIENPSYLSDCPKDILKKIYPKLTNAKDVGIL